MQVSDRVYTLSWYLMLELRASYRRPGFCFLRNKSDLTDAKEISSTKKHRGLPNIRIEFRISRPAGGLVFTYIFRIQYRS